VHVGCHLTNKYVGGIDSGNLRKISPQAWPPPKEVWRYSSEPNRGLSSNTSLYVQVTTGRLMSRIMIFPTEQF
jgi:hypothetical protein